MKRSLVLLSLLLVLPTSSGCGFLRALVCWRPFCGPYYNCHGGCTTDSCRYGGEGVWGCHGCGARYWGDFWNPPVDCCEPCDMYGNYMGPGDQNGCGGGWSCGGCGYDGCSSCGGGGYGGSGCSSCGGGGGYGGGCSSCGASYDGGDSGYSDGGSMPYEESHAPQAAPRPARAPQPEPAAHDGPMEPVPPAGAPMGYWIPQRSRSPRMANSGVRRTSATAARRRPAPRAPEYGP